MCFQGKYCLESLNKFQFKRKSARYIFDNRNAIFRPIPYAIVRLKRMKSVLILKPYEPTLKPVNIVFVKIIQVF